MSFLKMFESLFTPEKPNDTVVAGNKILYSFKHLTDTANPSWHTGYALATAGDAVLIGYSMRKGCNGTWYNQGDVRIRKVTGNG